LEQEPILQEVQSHLDNNNLDPTDKMIMRLVRENHIKTIQAEELAEEASKYPSILWMIVKKPLMFFPAAGALFLLLSAYYIAEVRTYLLALMGLPPIEPEKYTTAIIPIVTFLLLTSVVGAKKDA